MLLETPKEEGRRPAAIDVDPLDEQNLNTLRALVLPRAQRARGC